MNQRPIHICASTLLADPFALTPGQWSTCLDACSAASVAGLSVWSLHLMTLEQAGMDVQATLDEHELEISCVEAIAGWANAASVDDAVKDARFTIEMAGRYGAANIAAVLLDPTLHDPEQAAANLAAIADLAAAIDAWICLEYLPWSGIADIAAAWALIERAEWSNVGFLFDSWHWHRQPGSSGPANSEALRAIPGDRIRVFQVCDAASEPSGDMMHEAMTRRPLPGDGVVDHRGLFGIFDDIGADPVVCPEVFNAALVGQGPHIAVREIVRATRSVLSDWP